MVQETALGRLIGHIRGKQALPDLVRIIAKINLFYLPADLDVPAGLGAF